MARSSLDSTVRAENAQDTPWRKPRASTLSIWWDDRCAGHLAPDADGQVNFTYDKTWLDWDGSRPISLSLPLRRETYGASECLPYFDGLLPDGALRTATAKALKLQKNDVFGLLQILGEEVAGAIKICSGQDYVSQTPAQAAALSDRAISMLLRGLRTKPLLTGQHSGNHASLTGSQAKLPVAAVENGFALPGHGMPSTHIFKPEPPGLEGAVENEAICMHLAADLGLDAAPVQYATAGSQIYLIVQRYDRLTGGAGETLRLHQEDFCQAMGLPSACKYAERSGPEFWDCRELIERAATDPKGESLKLLDAAVFNAVVGNADAHARNFNLLYRHEGTVLAPLCGLLSTVFHPELESRFAMRIGKCWNLENLRSAEWSQFAGDIGVTTKQAIERVEAIADGVRTRVIWSLANLMLPLSRRRVGKRIVRILQARAEMALRSTEKKHFTPTQRRDLRLGRAALKGNRFPLRYSKQQPSTDKQKRQYSSKAKPLTAGE